MSWPKKSMSRFGPARHLSPIENQREETQGMPPTTTSPADDNHGGLWDIHAVARRLGVQVRHVRRLVTERHIPYLKWGHLLRFDPTEIEDWLNGARRPPAA